MESLAATKEQRFLKTHANLKDLPCGKAPGVKVRHRDTRTEVSTVYVRF